MNERWKYAKKIDFLLLSVVFVLFCFGLIGISVAMKNPTAEDEISFLKFLEALELRYVILALIWFFTGCILATVAAIINYRSLKTWIPYFYMVIMVALVGVYFLGTSAGGATSWFQIGPFKFQPSEFAKPVLILALATVLSSPRFENGVRRWRDLFILGLVIAPPFLLIMIQPDMGTAMVIAFITLFMIFASGISLKLVIPSVAVVGGGALVVWNFILNNAQKNRILVFLDPSLDPLGAGYHLNQSLIAVGSGKFFGKGIFGETTLSQLDYLPAKHTDFIFAVIVEAMGLVTGVIIILLFMLMLWRIIRIGLHSQDKIGKLICMGVAAMLAAHIFENIGMTMGITPITGIPLPFLSYGGSSMWTNLISIGLVTSIAIRRESDVFSDEKNKYHVASGPLDISLK